MFFSFLLMLLFILPRLIIEVSTAKAVELGIRIGDTAIFALPEDPVEKR